MKNSNYYEIEVDIIKLNYRWIAISSLLLFLPIILTSYFFHVSLETTGYPIGTFDAVNTHYQHEYTPYAQEAPLIQSLNMWAFWLSEATYDMYFMLFCIVIFLFAPFIILWDINKSLEYPTFFLYGTAIWVNNLTVGLLPQAIFISLMLLMVKRPKWLPYALILGFLVHSMGIFFVLIGWIYGRYREGSFNGLRQNFELFTRRLWTS